MRIKQILLEYNHEKTVLNVRKNTHFQDIFLDDLDDHKPFFARIGVDADLLSDVNQGGREIMEMFADLVVTYLEKVDPTSKKAYVVAMVNWYLDRSMRSIEDAAKLTPAILTIQKFKNRLVGFDPMKISFDDFLDKEDQLEGVKSKTEVSKDEAQKFFDDGDATLYYDGPDCKIIIPRTYEASMFFGRGTKWCTAMKNDSQYFFDYAQEGPLYMILFKGQSKRWQFHFPHMQFMDEQDHELETDTDEFQKIIQHFQPAIMDIIENSLRDHEVYAGLGILDWIPRLPDEVLAKLDYVYRTSGVTVLDKVPSPSKDLIEKCFAANPNAFRWLDYPTPEQQISAYKRAPQSINNFDYPCEELQMMMIDDVVNNKRNRRSIANIKNLSPMVAEHILQVGQEGLFNSITHVPDETQMVIAKLKPKAMEYLYYKSKEACRLAISIDPICMDFVSPEFVDKDLCLAAVKKRPDCIAFVPYKFITEEMTEIAVRANPYMIRSIPVEKVTPDLKALAASLMRSGREERHYKRDIEQHWRAQS
jgi:hypothetical protein